MVGALAEGEPEEKEDPEATGDSTTQPQRPIIGYGAWAFHDLGDAAYVPHERREEATLPV